MITITKLAVAPARTIQPAEDLEALFREAKQRARRRRLSWAGASFAAAVIGLVVAGAGFGAFGDARSRSALPSSSTATQAQVLTCAGKLAIEPATFVISCADANAMLGATHWSSWTSAGATGTTTFGLNLCNPYCAASKPSSFPRSTVRLFAPVATKRGELFSKLVVTYKINGKTASYAFSWNGEPAF